MSIQFEQSPAEHIAGMLAWCGGAKVELIREYPEERTRLATIGATVLFTGLFAGASSSYAIYTVFGAGWWVPTLAVLWGAAIFNIDRLIVMTMHGDFVRKLLAAIPRLVLATVIAIVITRPLELWIFAPEIDRAIKVAEGKYHADNMDSWSQAVQKADKRYQEDIIAAGAAAGVGTSKAALDGALTKVTECNQNLEQVASEHRAELNGTGGSKRYGNGPVAKELLKRVQAAEARCEEMAKAAAVAQESLNAALLRQSEAPKDHIEKRNKAIAEAEKLRDKQSDALDSTRIDSLLGRNQQLANLAAADTSVFRMNLFLMLLFWLIEALPVLAKLMTGDSIYDAVVNERREAAVRVTHLGAAKTAEAHEDTMRVEAVAAASARKEAIKIHYQGLTDIIAAARAKWHPPQTAVDDLLAAIERTARQALAGAQPEQSDLDGASWSLAGHQARSVWRPLLETAVHLCVALALVILAYFAFKVISPFDRAIINYVMTAFTAIGSLVAFKPLKRKFVRLSGRLTREEQ